MKKFRISLNKDTIISLIGILVISFYMAYATVYVISDINSGSDFSTIPRYLVDLILCYIGGCIFIPLLNNSYKEEWRVKADSRNCYPLPKENNINGERIVFVKDIKSDNLLTAVSEFNTMYGCKVQPNLIEHKDGIILSFNDSCDFKVFSCLVNYIQYCNTSKIYKTVGWYTMSKVINDSEEVQLSNKIVMIYIPDADEEYDVVNILTSHNALYSFSFTEECLRPIKINHERYNNPPKK